MKKVGIMSMQRIINYGSFLQAYALSNIIKKLGCEVEFVDFEFEKSIVKENKDKQEYDEIAKREFEIMKEKFEKEYLPKLGIIEKNIKPYVDTLVIGSDEVFNCMQEYPIGYSRQLFGHDHNANKLITYAASAGSTTIEKVKEAKIDTELKELLNSFNSISVRDENTKKLVEELAKQKTVQNLDPVLVYNFEDVIIEKKDIKDYIIVYSYVMRFNDKENEEIIKFAKKYNKKILTIGAYQKCSDVHITVHPFELLGYFKNADYIITDTFHGTIFSAKYNKKFVSIIRESNKQKLRDLLKKLNLEDREVKDLSLLEKIIIQQKDYSKTKKIIEEEKENTIKYLSKNI